MRLAPAAALLAFALPLAAIAQEEEAKEPEPGKDSPLLKRYPGAVMTSLDEKEFEEFQFPTGDGESEVTTKPVEGGFFHAEYTYPLKASCTQVIRSWIIAGFKTRSAACVAFAVRWKHWSVHLKQGRVVRKSCTRSPPREAR